MRIKLLFTLLIVTLPGISLRAQNTDRQYTPKDGEAVQVRTIPKHVFDPFDLIDLDRPGLERVARILHEGTQPKKSLAQMLNSSQEMVRLQTEETQLERTAAATEALVEYYRTRNGVVFPDVDLTHILITPDEQRWADEALRHQFFVHVGYQPSYFYGDDIDWEYWPVKDNELRWQLHRTKWWVPMGKAYRLSGDEKYAREWSQEYLDWIKKNPLTKYDPAEAKDWTHADNVYFAWRPLEVSDRLEFQIHQFLYFLPSPSFDGYFLARFLDNYHRHAQHITRHFSPSGNHLLFQAQRLIFAGVFFPEFKDAASWRKTGVEILNREIQKQVYADGMQYELDPHYHWESINIFYKALRLMVANGYRGDFPEEYLQTVERMIEIHANYMFPDYTMPMFSDAKLHTRETLGPDFKVWEEVYPENRLIRYYSSDQTSECPDYLSRAFLTSGFYTLRNGWDMESTVMVLKAGPKAFWHCQPDNGTFELWSRGRNFFPDSGSFVYGGDKEVMKLRNLFRETRMHNTMTLDGRNLQHTSSRNVKWQSEEDFDRVTVETPGYDSLTHRRTVWFVDRKFYVLLDEAEGKALGNVELNYHLVESDPAEDADRCRVATRFDDGNNLLMQVFAPKVSMKRWDGWVSRTYRHREARPSYTFTVSKQDDTPVRFVTVIIPSASGSEKISAKVAKNGDVRVKVNGRKYDLKY